MVIFKKMSLLLLSSILLVSITGCGKLSTSPQSFQPDFEGQIYYGENFAVYIPKDWITIQQFDVQLPKETLVAFKMPGENNESTTNVTITKTSLEENMNSLDFVKQKLARHAKTLIKFTEITKNSIQLINDGKENETWLILFSGQSYQEGKLLKFLQTGLVAEKKGYLITATMDETQDEKTFEIIKGILQSFQLGEEKLLKNKM